VTASRTSMSPDPPSADGGKPGRRSPDSGTALPAGTAGHRSGGDATVLVARFTIYGEPVSKERARVDTRRAKTRGYTPEKTDEAQRAAGWTFRQAAPRHRLDPEASYAVVAKFFCGTKQRRDTDNMLKLILDGLNQVAWPDDEQVTEVIARKAAVIPAHARTEVTVYRTGTMRRFVADSEQCGCGCEPADGSTP
jgi:Holliday junction resolvase RusA-like endonuclease